MAQQKISFKEKLHNFGEMLSRTPLGRLGNWLKNRLNDIGGFFANVGTAALLGRKGFTELVNKEMEREYAREISGLSSKKNAPEKDTAPQPPDVAKKKEVGVKEAEIKEQPVILPESEPFSPEEIEELEQMTNRFQLDPKEEKALNTLIAEQNKLGAKLDEDITSECYEWENGHLVGVHVPNQDLSGQLSLGAFPELKKLDVAGNQIQQLDIKQNKNLKILQCSKSGLESLDVTQNPKLEVLDCSATRISSIDLRSNPGLKNILCKSDMLKEITISPETRKNTILQTNGKTKITEAEISREPLSADDLLKGVAEVAKSASEAAKDAPDKDTSRMDKIVNDAKEKLLGKKKEEEKITKERTNQRTNAVSKLSPEQKKDASIRESAQNLDNTEISNMNLDTASARKTEGLENITDETPDDELGAFLPNEAEEVFTKSEIKSLDENIQEAKEPSNEEEASSPERILNMERSR